MDIINTGIKDVLLFKPSIYNDSRGYFFESYNQNLLSKHDFNINFIQDNESKSSYGVLRGLHFQKKPYEQAKLVRVLKGKILDVAVDIRPDSSTFKQYVSEELSENNYRQLFIPEGFAHGFVVLSDEAIILYKVNNQYNPKLDSGYKYDDPSFNVDWLINKKNIILSNKDKRLPYLIS